MLSRLLACVVEDASLDIGLGKSAGDQHSNRQPKPSDQKRVLLQRFIDYRRRLLRGFDRAVPHPLSGVGSKLGDAARTIPHERTRRRRAPAHCIGSGRESVNGFLLDVVHAV